MAEDQKQRFRRLVQTLSDDDRTFLDSSLLSTYRNSLALGLQKNWLSQSEYNNYLGVGQKRLDALKKIPLRDNQGNKLSKTVDIQVPTPSGFVTKQKTTPITPLDLLRKTGGQMEGGPVDGPTYTGFTLETGAPINTMYGQRQRFGEIAEAGKKSAKELERTKGETKFYQPGTAVGLLAGGLASIPVGIGKAVTAPLAAGVSRGIGIVNPEASRQFDESLARAYYPEATVDVSQPFKTGVDVGQIAGINFAESAPAAVAATIAGGAAALPASVATTPIGGAVVGTGVGLGTAFAVNQAQNFLTELALGSSYKPAEKGFGFDVQRSPLSEARARFTQERSELSPEAAFAGQFATNLLLGTPTFSRGLVGATKAGLAATKLGQEGRAALTAASMPAPGSIAERFAATPVMQAGRAVGQRLERIPGVGAAATFGRGFAQSEPGREFLSDITERGVEGSADLYFALKENADKPVDKRDPMWMVLGKTALGSMFEGQHRLGTMLNAPGQAFGKSIVRKMDERLGTFTPEAYIPTTPPVAPSIGKTTPMSPTETPVVSPPFTFGKTRVKGESTSLPILDEGVIPIGGGMVARVTPTGETVVETAPPVDVDRTSATNPSIGRNVLDAVSALTPRGSAVFGSGVGRTANVFGRTQTQGGESQLFLGLTHDGLAMVKATDTKTGESSIDLVSPDLLIGDNKRLATQAFKAGNLLPSDKTGYQRKNYDVELSRAADYEPTSEGEGPSTKDFDKEIRISNNPIYGRVVKAVDNDFSVMQIPSPVGGFDMIVVPNDTVTGLKRGQRAVAGEVLDTTSMNLDMSAYRVDRGKYDPIFKGDSKQRITGATHPIMLTPEQVADAATRKTNLGNFRNQLKAEGRAEGDVNAQYNAARDKSYADLRKATPRAENDYAVGSTIDFTAADGEVSKGVVVGNTTYGPTVVDVANPMSPAFTVQESQILNSSAEPTVKPEPVKKTTTTKPKAEVKAPVKKVEPKVEPKVEAVKPEPKVEKKVEPKPKVEAPKVEKKPEPVKAETPKVEPTEAQRAKDTQAAKDGASQLNVDLTYNDKTALTDAVSSLLGKKIDIGEGESGEIIGTNKTGELLVKVDIEGSGSVIRTVPFDSTLFPELDAILGESGTTAFKDNIFIHPKTNGEAIGYEDTSEAFPEKFDLGVMRVGGKDTETFVAVRKIHDENGVAIYQASSGQILFGASTNTPVVKPVNVPGQRTRRPSGTYTSTPTITVEPAKVEKVTPKDVSSIQIDFPSVFDDTIKTYKIDLITGDVTQLNTETNNWEPSTGLQVDTQTEADGISRIGIKTNPLSLIGTGVKQGFGYLYDVKTGEIKLRLPFVKSGDEKWFKGDSGDFRSYDSNGNEVKIGQPKKVEAPKAKATEVTPKEAPKAKAPEVVTEKAPVAGVLPRPIRGGLNRVTEGVKDAKKKLVDYGIQKRGNERNPDPYNQARFDEAKENLSKSVDSLATDIVDTLSKLSTLKAKTIETLAKDINSGKVTPDSRANAESLIKNIDDAVASVKRDFNSGKPVIAEHITEPSKVDVISKSIDRLEGMKMPEATKAEPKVEPVKAEVPKVETKPTTEFTPEEQKVINDVEAEINAEPQLWGRVLTRIKGWDTFSDAAKRKIKSLVSDNGAELLAPEIGDVFDSNIMEFETLPLNFTNRVAKVLQPGIIAPDGSKLKALVERGSTTPVVKPEPKVEAPKPEVKSITGFTADEQTAIDKISDLLQQDNISFGRISIATRGWNTFSDAAKARINQLVNAKNAEVIAPEFGDTVDESIMDIGFVPSDYSGKVAETRQAGMRDKSTGDVFTAKVRAASRSEISAGKPQPTTPEVPKVEAKTKTLTPEEQTALDRTKEELEKTNFGPALHRASMTDGKSYLTGKWSDQSDAYKQAVIDAFDAAGIDIFDDVKLGQNYDSPDVKDKVDFKSAPLDTKKITFITRPRMVIRSTGTTVKALVFIGDDAPSIALKPTTPEVPKPVVKPTISSADLIGESDITPSDEGSALNVTLPGDVQVLDDDGSLVRVQASIEGLEDINDVFRKARNVDELRDVLRGVIKDAGILKSPADIDAAADKLSKYYDEWLRAFVNRDLLIAQQYAQGIRKFASDETSGLQTRYGIDEEEITAEDTPQAAKQKRIRNRVARLYQAYDMPRIGQVVDLLNVEASKKVLVKQPDGTYEYATGITFFDKTLTASQKSDVVAKVQAMMLRERYRTNMPVFSVMSKAPQISEAFDKSFVGEGAYVNIKNKDSNVGQQVVFITTNQADVSTIVEELSHAILENMPIDMARQVATKFGKTLREPTTTNESIASYELQEMFAARMRLSLATGENAFTKPGESKKSQARLSNVWNGIRSFMADTYKAINGDITDAKLPAAAVTQWSVPYNPETISLWDKAPILFTDDDGKVKWGQIQPTDKYKFGPGMVSTKNLEKPIVNIKMKDGTIKDIKPVQVLAISDMMESTFSPQFGQLILNFISGSKGANGTSVVGLINSYDNVTNATQDNSYEGLTGKVDSFIDDALFDYRLKKESSSASEQVKAPDLLKSKIANLLQGIVNQANRYGVLSDVDNDPKSALSLKNWLNAIGTLRAGEGLNEKSAFAKFYGKDAEFWMQSNIKKLQTAIRDAKEYSGALEGKGLFDDDAYHIDAGNTGGNLLYSSRQVGDSSEKNRALADGQASTLNPDAVTPVDFAMTATQRGMPRETITPVVQQRVIADAERNGLANSNIRLLEINDVLVIDGTVNISDAGIDTISKAIDFAARNNIQNTILVTKATPNEELGYNASKGYSVEPSITFQFEDPIADNVYAFIKRMHPYVRKSIDGQSLTIHNIEKKGKSYEESLKAFEQATSRIAKELAKRRIPVQAIQDTERVWNFGNESAQGYAVPYYEARNLLHLINPQVLETGQRPVADPRIKDILQTALSTVAGRNIKLPDIDFSSVPDNHERRLAMGSNYDKLPTNSYDTNPETKEAYDSLMSELDRQFSYLKLSAKEIGSDSTAKYTLPDVVSTKHPLMQDSKHKDVDGNPLRYIDVLNAIHDSISDSVKLVSGGEHSDLMAFAAHSAITKDPKAIRALYTETLGRKVYEQLSGKDVHKAALPTVEDTKTGIVALDKRVQALYAETKSPYGDLKKNEVTNGMGRIQYASGSGTPLYSLRPIRDVDVSDTGEPEIASEENPVVVVDDEGTEVTVTEEDKIGKILKFLDENPVTQSFDVLNALGRFTMAGDWSAPLVQNWQLANPIESPGLFFKSLLFGPKSLAPNLAIDTGKGGINKNAFLGRRQVHAMGDEIRANRFYELAKENGLSLATIEYDRILAEKRAEREDKLAQMRERDPDATLPEIDIMDINELDVDPDMMGLLSAERHFPGKAASERAMTMMKDFVKFNKFTQALEAYEQLGYDPSSDGFKEMASDMAAILNVMNGDVRFTANEYDKSIGRLMRRVMFAPRWLTSRVLTNPILRAALEKYEPGRKWLKANNLPTGRTINPYVLRANIRMVLKAQALWYALLAYFGLMRPFDQFQVKTSVDNMFTRIQVGNYVFKAPGGSMMLLEIADGVYGEDYKNLPPDEARKRFAERMETLVMGRFINSPGIGIMKEMFTGRDFMGKPVGYVDPDLEAYWQKVIKPTMAEVGVPVPDMRLSKLITKNIQYLWLQSYLETFKAADDREEDDKMFEAAFVGGMSALGGRIRYNPPVGKGSYDYDTYGNPPGWQYYILGANREEWLMNPAAELSQEQIDAMEKEVVE